MSSRDIPLLIKSASASSERRITPSWTITQLKQKLEPVTGISPTSQKLVLSLPSGQKIPIEADDEGNVQLARWDLIPYAEIEVCLFIWLGFLKARLEDAKHVILMWLLDHEDFLFTAQNSSSASSSLHNYFSLSQLFFFFFGLSTSLSKITNLFQILTIPGSTSFPIGLQIESFFRSHPSPPLLQYLNFRLSDQFLNMSCPWKPTPPFPVRCWPTSVIIKLAASIQRRRSCSEEK